MRNLKMGLLVAASFAAIAASPAFATNNGFETGDLTGWALTNGGGATTGIGVFGPTEGSYLGYVVGGSANVYSTLSQTFTLGIGQTLTGNVGYQTTDYVPFGDDGYLRVNGVDIFTASTYSVGDFGNSGWVGFSYTALTAGSYTLELGVRNTLDSGFAPIAVLDNVTAGAVPEPASWALMLGGFGLVGSAMRRRRTSVAFG